MSIETAVLIWSVVGLYFGIGFVFALAFILLGVKRIYDPAANTMSWPSRFIILPGCTVLWPLLLMRWISRKGPPPS